MYRGESSIWEYLAAGLVTGTLYKFSMGLRGMAAGGLVGTVLGGIAGCASILVLRASGTTMEEVRYWQYKWRASRDDAINEGLKKHSTIEPDQLLELHDKRLGETKLDLNLIPNKESQPVLVSTTIHPSKENEKKV